MLKTWIRISKCSKIKFLATVSNTIVSRDQISYLSILREIMLHWINVFLTHLPMWLSIMNVVGKDNIEKSFPISVEQVRMKEDRIFSYEDAKNDFGYSR